MHPPLSDVSLSALLDFLAREEVFVFLETTRAKGDECRSLLFREPVAMLRCTGGDSAGDFFAEARGYLARGHYLAGWFAYEFGYLLEPSLAGLGWVGQPPLLAELGVYNEPHVYDHRSSSFSGRGPWPTTPGGGAPGEYRLRNLRLNQQQQEYLAAIQRIKQYIAAGDTYQVNYTLKLLFDFSGSAEGFYQTLRRNQSVAYGAYLRNGLHRLLSFSPELFFRKKGERCTVRPMKGTARRGRSCEEDAAIAAWLRADAKNRSENVMIVDLLRNDLGRVCTMGSVRTDSLFDVETYESLHQMTSTIHGRLRPDVGLAELFGALFPCGSVTGAPKIRTMEIIRELELAPRGVYTGAIGYLAPDGDAFFNVPIRTVVLDGGRGEMGIGSGVVFDSDPVGEWEECGLKGSFLTEPRPSFELIETLLWEPGQGYWLLDLHLARLARSAAFFDYPLDRQRLTARLAEAAEAFGPGSAQRVRLTLARDGGFCLAATPCGLPGARTFAEADVPAKLPRVTFADGAVDSRSPYLFHKTTRRELYDRERQLATAEGFYEVLFVNQRGEVTEGAITNLFVRLEGRLLTPPVDCGLLDGVFRRQLLSAGQEPVAEAVLTREDLAAAEAIYLGNSVRGLVRVSL
ncbi:MAG: aminodeoxychorismate synthase component I [Desulfobulbaceae bacterium]|nr:aminodeoxychorismate synthase component I [Desulfobulbaceae bacterium]